MSRSARRLTPTSGRRRPRGPKELLYGSRFMTVFSGRAAVLLALVTLAWAAGAQTPSSGAQEAPPLGEASPESAPEAAEASAAVSPSETRTETPPGQVTPMVAAPAKAQERSGRAAKPQATQAAVSATAASTPAASAPAPTPASPWESGQTPPPWASDFGTAAVPGSAASHPPAKMPEAPSAWSRPPLESQSAPSWTTTPGPGVGRPSGSYSGWQASAPSSSPTYYGTQGYAPQSPGGRASAPYQGTRSTWSGDPSRGWSTQEPSRGGYGPYSYGTGRGVVPSVSGVPDYGWSTPSGRSGQAASGRIPDYGADPRYGYGGYGTGQTHPPAYGQGHAYEGPWMDTWNRGNPSAREPWGRRGGPTEYEGAPAPYGDAPTGYGSAQREYGASSGGYGGATYWGASSRYDGLAPQAGYDAGLSSYRNAGTNVPVDGMMPRAAYDATPQFQPYHAPHSSTWQDFGSGGASGDQPPGATGFPQAGYGYGGGSQRGSGTSPPYGYEGPGSPAFGGHPGM